VPPAPPSPPVLVPPKSVEVTLERGSLVNFTTIGFDDSETFDLLLEGALQSRPARVALVTDAAYDGVRAPKFPPRLNGWIDLWKQANPDRGIAWVKVVLPQPALPDRTRPLEKGKKGISLISIDLSRIDPHRSILAAGQVIQGWVESLSGAAAQWIHQQQTREARKSLLAGYELSLVSLHGKAALLLTTEPIASIADRIARYAK
jgi:hypothetical protein